MQFSPISLELSIDFCVYDLWDTRVERSLSNLLSSRFLWNSWILSKNCKTFCNLCECTNNIAWYVCIGIDQRQCDCECRRRCLLPSEQCHRVHRKCCQCSSINQIVSPNDTEEYSGDEESPRAPFGTRGHFQCHSGNHLHTYSPITRISVYCRAFYVK